MVGFQPFDHLGLGVLHAQAGQEAGVDADTGLHVGECALGDVHFPFGAGDHLHHGQTESLSELPVTGVVGGNGHDGAGAVGGQDVVGDKDGDLLVVHRVDGPDALQFHAGLFLDQLGALEVGLGGGHADVFGHFVIVGQLVLPLFHIGVLGGDDHVSRAKEGVAAGGVDGEDVPFGGVEVHVSAGGAADPVLLLGHHTGQEVNGIQTVDELLGVSGDLQHPLALFLPDDFRAAALQTPLTTSSLARTHLQLVHQLTGMEVL